MTPATSPDVSPRIGARTNMPYSPPKVANAHSPVPGGVGVGESACIPSRNTTVPTVRHTALKNNKAKSQVHSRGRGGEAVMNGSPTSAGQASVHDKLRGMWVPG